MHATKTAALESVCIATSISMQGEGMSKSVSRGFAAIAVFFGLSAAVSAQGASAPALGDEGRVVGIAFVGRLVADLDKSVPFYQSLGFKQDPGADPAWRKDEFTEALYGVKDMQTRMAKMVINASASGKPFAVYLREIKGIERKQVGGTYPPWEPGAPHFGLVVPDAPALWAELEKNGTLRARSWDGKLIPFPGETRGALAYMTDPDGLDIEIINQRPATPAADGRPARPALTPGVNHVGVIILDSDKARAFYETLFGGKLVNAEQPWLKGDFYDSAVGGHGNVLRFFNESFPEAADRDQRMNLELVEFQNRKKPVEPYKMGDIGTSYVGFEVEGLDAFLPRVKAAGAQMISQGIPVMRTGTRVVMVRDPDTGAFVQLFEHPKK
jgi:catechol 2,3-dioxygenase-like lactoylglutathione lyase family enzyme